MTARRDQVTHWPTGHIGWIYAGVAEFQGRATTFLSEGAARGERLMLVADDPRTDLWPRALVDERRLIVLSTCDVYGPERTVDPGAQRATFDAALREALADGYAGLRVAADSTSLVEGPERLAAWMRWEEEADGLMRVEPITGLCSFDRARVDPATLHTVMAVHRQGPTPGAVAGRPHCL